MLTDSIDAIALVGHAVSELSALKCEQLKPSLRPEFHTKCANNATTTSNLLFGDDLGNNSGREGDERLGKTVAGPSNKQFDQNKGYRRNRSWSNRSGKKKNTTKVDHGRLFWAKATAKWKERNFITTGTNQKRNNCILGK